MRPRVCGKCGANWPQRSAGCRTPPPSRWHAPKACWSSNCRRPTSFSEPETAAIMGAVRGLEALVRISRKVAPLQARTWDRLRWSATAQRPQADPRSAWIRRLAMAALVTANEATPSIVERGLGDRDVEVRRLAALAAGAEADVRRSRAAAAARPQGRQRPGQARGRARLGTPAPGHDLRTDPGSGQGPRSARQAAGDRSAERRVPGVRGPVTRTGGAGRRALDSAARVACTRSRHRRPGSPRPRRRGEGVAAICRAPDLAGADVRGSRRRRARQHERARRARRGCPRQRPRGSPGRADRRQADRGRCRGARRTRAPGLPAGVHRDTSVRRSVLGADAPCRP